MDPACVYKRVEEEYFYRDKNHDDKTKVVIKNPIVEELRTKLPRYRSFSEERLILDDSFIILFCGRLYPCIVFRVTPKHPHPTGVDNSKYIWCYSYKDTMSVLNKYLKIKRRKRNRHLGRFSRYNQLGEENLRSLFRPQNDMADFELKGLMDIHYKTGIPSFAILDEKIIYNPVLKKYKFYKIFDAFHAFQELAMFVSGVLGGTSPPMIEIEDKIRLEEHGFDSKTSFRKEKEK
jgi:hypothetical protein